MQIASWVFTPEVFVPIVLLIGLVLLMRHRRLQEALFLLLLSGNGLTIILKPIFHRLRPTSAVANIINHQGGYSMPSGHTVAAVLFSLSVILLAGQRYKIYRWWLTIVMTILAVIVSLSRIYLGAHWPSDVLVGWIVAILWVTFIWVGVKPVLERWWIQRHQPSEE